MVALVFGPSNIAGLGKDLGKLAGSIKKEVICNTVDGSHRNECLQSTAVFQARAELREGAYVHIIVGS